MSKGNEQDCDNADYEDGALQREYSSLVQSNLHTLPERYQKAALDPAAKALWEEIGLDLSSSSEEKRVIAFTTFYILFPLLGGHLMDGLDERETHGAWRHELGKDQRFVNEGIDILSLLYIKWVKEGGFKPIESKDPRPYTIRAISNWQKNQYRKDQRHTHPDEEEWNILTESPQDSLTAQLLAPSAEEEAVSQISEDTFRGHLIEDTYLTEKEIQLFEALYVYGWKPKELAQILGKKAHAITQTVSTLHQRILLRREAAIITKIDLMMQSVTKDDYHYHFANEANNILIRLTKYPDWFAIEVEDAMKAALKSSASLEDSEQILLPLTSDIGGRPGRLYLVTGSQDDAQARLHSYLLTRGINNPHLQLNIFYDFWPENKDFVTTDIPIFDEITKRVREHCGTRPLLCILNDCSPKIKKRIRYNTTIGYNTKPYPFFLDLDTSEGDCYAEIRRLLAPLELLEVKKLWINHEVDLDRIPPASIRGLSLR